MDKHSLAITEKESLPRLRNDRTILFSVEVTGFTGTKGRHSAMRYLMLIHLGPVQEFIASARRSRDLWFGSWLLSELSKAAAHKLVEAQPGSLIFPTPMSTADLLPNSKFDVANKIVALVDLDAEGIKDLARSIRTAVDDRLETIRTVAYGHLRGPLRNDTAARAQVKDLVEFFWTALPVPDPTKYSEVRTRLESLMAARKSTRHFINTDNWKGSVPKSSLDGQRESVIPEDAYPNPNVPTEQRRTKLRNLRSKYGVRNGERLCGVGLLKRHGQRGEDDRFFSTSHVAALPLLNCFQADHKRAAEEYIHTLQDLEIDDSALSPVPFGENVALDRCDGHLLFEERLQEFFEEDKEKARLAQEALNRFLHNTVKKRPMAYYALLHADGDRMGKAIDAQPDPDGHRDLSSALSHFAGNVRSIVPEHDGSLVYAGGDDVLAFLPLHKVLECARVLAECFQNALNKFAVKEDDGQMRPPTLSVGVAVAHHLEPLSDALDLARAAEKKAKAVPGKNALAVTLSKRSGADRTVAGSWGEIDIRLERFVALHRVDAVPDGAAYELQDLALRLNPSGVENVENRRPLQAAMHFEAMRILCRKRARRGSEQVAEDELAELERYLTTHSVPLQQLAEELIVARIFADAKDLAQPSSTVIEGV